MASIDSVFRQAMSTGGIAEIILVSNQPDGIVCYTRGSLNRTVNQSGIQGNASMLFGDRILSVPDPTGSPFLLQQPFNIEGGQELQITLTSSGNGKYQLELNIPAPFNRDFHLTLIPVGDLAYGITQAIGNNERVEQAVHLISMSYIAPPR